MHKLPLPQQHASAQPMDVPWGALDEPLPTASRFVQKLLARTVLPFAG